MVIIETLLSAVNMKNAAEAVPLGATIRAGLERTIEGGSLLTIVKPRCACNPTERANGHLDHTL